MDTFIDFALDCDFRVISSIIFNINKVFKRAKIADFEWYLNSQNRCAKVLRVVNEFLWILELYDFDKK